MLAAELHHVVHVIDGAGVDHTIDRQCPARLLHVPAVAHDVRNDAPRGARCRVGYGVEPSLVHRVETDHQALDWIQQLLTTIQQDTIRVQDGTESHFHRSLQDLFQVAPTSWFATGNVERAEVLPHNPEQVDCLLGKAPGSSRPGISGCSSGTRGYSDGLRK